MLIKGNDVIGLKVVTLNEGKKLHRVEDIVYDPQSNQVRALVLDPGGWFQDAKVILMEDVYNIGHDAVVIASESLVKKASEIASRVANIAKHDHDLTRTRVITDTGTELGRISDILFDPKSGQVEEFEVSQGFKNFQSGKKTVRVDHIITIGEDVTVVRSSTEQYLEEQAGRQGIQGAFNRTKNDIKAESPMAMENIKAEAGDLGTRIQDKAEEVMEHPRTQSLADRIEAKTLEIKNRFQNRMDQPDRADPVDSKASDFSEPETDYQTKTDLSEDLTEETPATTTSNFTQPKTLDDFSEAREAERLGYASDVFKPGENVTTSQSEQIEQATNQSALDRLGETKSEEDKTLEEYDPPMAGQVHEVPQFYAHKVTVKKNMNPEKTEIDQE
jgi:uncharacterized protein YrrD